MKSSILLRQIKLFKIIFTKSKKIRTGQMCTKTFLHKGTLLHDDYFHEEIFLHKDTFAREVFFALRHFCMKGHFCMRVKN